MTPTLVTLPVFRAELHQFVQWARKNIREDINILVAQKLMAGRNVPGLSRSDEKLFRKHIQSLCAEQVDRDYVEKLDAACVIPNRRILSCGVGEQLTIKANGDMMICEYSLAPVGNVKNIGEDDAYILDVVDSSKKQFAPLGVRQLSPCQQCDLHYFCGGKCRVHNKQDFGDPNTCNCNGEEKNIWYERLVRISPYIVQPLTD